MKNLGKIKTIEANAPEAMKAFWAIRPRWLPMQFR